MKINDIPSEVLHVQAISWGKIPVGMDTYNKCKEVINKYPEHFPWEHKYNSIAKEVHDAFLREAYPERFKPWDVLEGGVKEGKGFLGRLPEPYVMKPFTKEVLEDFINTMTERDRKRLDYEKRIRNIWSKHYSKYKLECREF